ncbi:pantoate--beta-alanine ligase [Brachybacterium hainanense]|uniref:Pantothenate synthetase n=1 Tax=Brachybacterium hainanense TaxID=1541174 RepID=A0ABV6RBX5_9MICO
MTQIVTTKAQLRTARESLPGSVAVVMTMGALHEGHLMLVRRAREIADSVVVTIFVNPLQFGPTEDYEAYPRDLAGDVALLDGLADLVFAPEVWEMYPVLPPPVSVSAGVLGTRFEGAARPGHFDGVVTVVTKLLHLIAPDAAVFGRKDAQQLAILERLVADLDLPVRIEAVDIVREESGLARSSRNAYLSAAGRDRALVLSRTIAAVQEAAPDAAAVLAVLERAGRGEGDGGEAGEVRWAYAEAVDPATFESIGPGHHGEVLVVLAAHVEGTRLLDATTLVVSG